MSAGPGLLGQRFTFDWLGATYPVFFVMCLGESFSRIRLTDDALEVRMGWAFSATIPRTQVARVEHDAGLVTGIGVHGNPWTATWLVNGSHRNIVRVGIEPSARAWVCGVPLSLSTLRLGVAEKDAFVNALRREAN